MSKYKIARVFCCISCFFPLVANSAPRPLSPLMDSTAFTHNTQADFKAIECGLTNTISNCIPSQSSTYQPQQIAAFRSSSTVKRLPEISVNYQKRHLIISEYDDYSTEEETTNQDFSRHFNGFLSIQNLGFGSGWMSNFHSRIYSVNKFQLTILTPEGRLVRFEKSEKVFSAENLQYGKIEIKEPFLQWNSPKFGLIEFKGQFPVRVNPINGQPYTLHYRNNQLAEVRYKNGKSINFYYEGNGLQITEVEFSDGHTAYYSYNKNKLTAVTIKSKSSQFNLDTKNKNDLPLCTNCETIRNYQYEDSMPPERATLTGISAVAADKKKHRVLDAAYYESGHLRELTNYKTNTVIRFLKRTDSKHNFNQESKSMELKERGETQEKKPCETCTRTVSILADENTGRKSIKSGIFLADWVIENNAPATRFSVYTAKDTDPPSMDRSEETITIKHRDNWGRPTVLNSSRFGEVQISYKRKNKIEKQQFPIKTEKKSGFDNTGSVQSVSNISNKFNSINLQNHMDGYRPTVFTLSDRNPMAMANEAVTLVRLDIIARSLLDQHCLIDPITLPEGNDIDEAINTLPIVTNETTLDEMGPDSESQCNTQLPNPSTDSTPGNSSTISSLDQDFLFIDLQPEDCSSFFDITSPIGRGSAIEQAIGQHENYTNALHTAYWFPVVDFVIDRTAVVQISRDLSVDSYSGDTGAQTLYNRLMQEAAMISERFLQPLNENGFITASDSVQTTTINRNQIDNVRFELIIQQGMVNPEQLSQIELAGVEMLAQYGIQLNVITIP